jgi:hypothetical protein
MGFLESVRFRCALSKLRANYRDQAIRRKGVR